MLIGLDTLEAGRSGSFGVAIGVTGSGLFVDVGGDNEGNGILARSAKVSCEVLSLKSGTELRAIDGIWA